MPKIQYDKIKHSYFNNDIANITPTLFDTSITEEAGWTLVPGSVSVSLNTAKSQFLPYDIKVSSTGVLSGTVNNTPRSPSLYYIKLSVTGVSATYTTKTFTAEDYVEIEVLGPPTGITYNDFTVTEGNPYTGNSPTYSGGKPNTYSIQSGSLGGLSLDPTTGIISGTPTSYGTFTATIRACNAAGCVDDNVTITINPKAPTGLTYEYPNVVYGQGSNIVVGTTDTTNNPIIPNGVLITSYSITPTLPSGLTINSSTGIISGTPIVLQTTPITYTITGFNVSGNTTTTVSITINPPPPDITNYTNNNAVYVINTPITNNIPTYTGTPTNWSYVVQGGGSLPTGLNFNSSTGVFSGTPTSSTTGTIIVLVTATNSGGSDTYPINIKVDPYQPITSYTYNYNPINGEVGKNIINNNAIIVGGPAQSFTSLTTLPTGLLLNPTTGQITGTPSISINQVYTLRANDYLGGYIDYNMWINIDPAWVPSTFRYRKTGGTLL